MPRPINSKQQGFTIIELLIATSVFTVVLLLASFAVIQIGKTYYKGINSIATQDVARAIVDEVTQSIQFNGSDVIGPVNLGTGHRCFSVGPKRYFYDLDTQLVDSGTTPAFDQDHTVLVSDNDIAGCPPAGGPFGGYPAGAKELLGQRMRVSKLSIVKSTIDSSLYTISIRVVFGDRDLLCSPSQSKCNNSTLTNLSLLPTDLKCRSGAGSQFCAASELTTTVQKRI